MTHDQVLAIAIKKDLKLLDLKREIYSSWTAALSTDGAAPPPEPRSAVAYHAPLAILHPWSEGLDALPLAEVTASLNK